MKSNAVTAILLVLLLGGCAALLLVCGKSGKARYEPTPDLKGTYCEKLAKLPPPRPRGPLPQDATLAKWTVAMENAIEPMLALEALESNHSPRHNPMSGPDEACSKQLAETLKRDLPEKQSLLTAHHVEQEDCRSIDKFLGRFPDNNNARLRRALTSIYRCCVEDNFNSIDGELDRIEAFIRLTAKVLPERLGIDFELLTEDDWSVKMDSTFVWTKTPFGRTTLDLGPTGNALKVVRDIAKERPESLPLLLPTAKKWADSSTLPSHRRARWQALVTYIEAGAPDPGDASPAMERELIRAMESNIASARWALAFLPNELEEHAPRPYPYIKDADLIRVVTARTTSMTTASAREEDVVLGLDVVSRMPPGTALDWIVSYLRSTTDGVREAAVSAINRQIEQLPLDDGRAKITDEEAFNLIDRDEPKRKTIAKFLKPVQDVIVLSLKHRVCTDLDAFDLELKADNKSIDADFVSCLGPDPKLSRKSPEFVFSACLQRREFGWQLTGKALEAMAPPDDSGNYLRRIAKGCQTGQD